MRIWIIGLLSILLMACGKPAYDKIPSNGTILAFGDSLTYGYNVSAKESYPAVLEQLSGREVYNAGVSGEVTRDGLKRLKELLENGDESFDFIVLLEGGNDILQSLPASQTKQNLAAMIALAKQHNIPVLLIGVPEKALFSSSAPFYKELAQEHQLPFMGSLIADLLKQSEYKSDQVHFNKKGYRKMAEAIYKELQKQGAL